MTDGQSPITYERALVTAAILELELVGQATSLDPESDNKELLAQTSLAVTSMEALIATLFEQKPEQVHEDIAQLDPQIIKKAMQNLAMMHARNS